MSVPLYELAAAALLGVGTTSSSIFGAALGLYVSFSRWILACILAFAAGALISALAIELGLRGGASAPSFGPDAFGRMGVHQFRLRRPEGGIRKAPRDCTRYRS